MTKPDRDHNTANLYDEMASVQEQKKLIADFLSGVSTDHQKLFDAVHQLNSIAPQELCELQEHLTRGLSEPDCALFEEAIAEYAALGSEAEQKLPEIAQHLPACAFCQVLLQAHREILAQQPQWQALAQEIQQRSAIEKKWLLYTTQGWQWVVNRIKTEILTTNDRGTALGDWILGTFTEPSLKLARIHFGEKIVSLPPLDIILRDETAKLKIELAREYSNIRNKLEWILRCEIDKAFQIKVPKLAIAVSIADRHVTGFREISPDKATEFILDPPTKDFYWLHVEWELPMGSRQEYKCELPLIEATKEDTL